MGTPREENYDKKVVPAAEKVARYLDMKTSDVAPAVAKAAITLPNGKVRELGRTIGYIDNNVNAGFAQMQGAIAGLGAALAEATQNPAITSERVEEILDAAASKAFGVFELRRVQAEQNEQNEEAGA